MKIGKTHFAAKQLPKSLLMGFEKGWSAIPGVMAAPIDKWVTFKKLIKQLESSQAKEKYENIIIDTVDQAASLCEEYICQQNGIKSLSEIPFGKGYSEYGKELSNAFRKITMMGYGVCFITHQEVKVNKNDKGEDYETIQPALDRRTLKIVNGMVDFILYVGSEWDSNGVNQRYFYTRNTPRIVAGSRFGQLQPKIPFTYEALISEIQKAMEKDAEENPGLLINEEVEYAPEEKRPFKDCMAEAGQIWAQFPKTQEWNERKMKVVEDYFGQPIKLSTATEPQQDLVESVIFDLKNLLSTIK